MSVDEACPLPPSPTPPAPSAASPLGHEALRRFHLGDPGVAAPSVPDGLLPAALAPLRGVEVRGGWPLLIDTDPQSESFARRFGDWLAESLAEDSPLAAERGRLEQRVAGRLGGAVRSAAELLSEAAGELAGELELDEEANARFAAASSELAARLGPGTLLLGFERDAALEIARRAAERRLARARERFAARGRELAAAADALLEADRARRAGAGSSREQVGRMGALGARFVDPEKLAGIVSHRRSGEPLAEERRSGLERARRQLGETPSASGEAQWFLARGFEPRETGGSVRFVDDPCAAAARAFDRAAAEVALLVRAARLTSLEAANALDPDRHLPWLDRLDWRGFDADELALVPPIFAVVRRSELATGGLASLSRLLLSGRPVEVLVIGDETGLAGAAAFEPALIGMAHREVFVLQASVAAPLELARGLERAARGRRGALVVLDAAPDGPDSLDPWLVASARVAGRAAPLLVFDPDAGESWSRRLELDGNPDAVADWPGGPLVGAETAGNGSEAASFTYADAALLDPAWRTELAAAGAAQADLVPLADWLALAPGEALRRLPTVRAVDPEGNEMNLVVTRALASAARERLSFWRHLEELAGVRAEAVEEAAGRARAEAEERAARARVELEQAQAAELERVRAEADSTAAARIVQALIALGGGAPVAIGAVEAPAPPAAAAPPPAAAAAEAAAAPAAAEASEEVWIDTALCTSCDECIRKFPGIFVYNSDKQAVVKNPRGGSFRDIVAAAAACTARVIHPGKPWSPSEPDLAKWVEKAKAYQ